MNSALQCLINNHHLRAFYLDQALYQGNLNPANHARTGSPLTRAFSSMLDKVWNGAASGYGVAPRELKQVMGSNLSAYSGGDQRDSREFMSSLIDLLHKEINRVTKRLFIDHPDMRSINGYEQEKLMFQYYETYLH